MYKDQLENDQLENEFMCEDDELTEEERETVEFVRFLAQIDYARRKKQKKTLILDPVQVRKYKEAFIAFEKIVKANEGKVNIIPFDPDTQNAYLEAEVPYFKVWGEELQEFIKIMQTCDVFDIDTKDDGTIIISFNMHDIFKRID